MNFAKHLGIALLCALTPAAQAQSTTHKYTVKGGFVLRAQAYRDKAYAPKEQSRHYAFKEQSRYSFEVVQVPQGAGQWDFTLDDDPEYHYIYGVGGAVSPTPYGSSQQMIIHATLHQYDTYKEQVTFHNLDLVPLADDFATKDGDTPRFLALKSALTVTTPSGIQITLPAQNVQHFEDMFSVYNGNINALFIRIETSPNQKLVPLPESPLYKQHPQPVRIALDCVKPNSMVFYQADNTYKIIAVGLPDLKTVMHLDTLTLIVRQRVDLRSVPVTLTVPVDRSVGG